MDIWLPCERVWQPLIGSNHMHLIVCREGDETSMLVERHLIGGRVVTSLAHEERDVMAIVSECLKPIVAGISDDDSALVGDAHALRIQELAWLIALRAELEQERAIDQ